MIKYCHLNGNIVNASEASLKVGDLAILRGYGIFDFFTFQYSFPHFFDDYLDRFINSSKRLRLDLPYSRADLKQFILDLIQANGETQGGMRLVLTGGYAEDGYTPVAPNFIMLQYPLPTYSADKYEKGLSLMTFQHQRELPEVKTINYITGIWLLDKIRDANADDVLYHDGTYIRESVRSNFFLVSEEGTLITPADKILMGITRKQILEAVEGIIEVEERDVLLNEVKTAQEAFLTSSTKGAMPVVQIDGHEIGTGEPGPVTKKVMELLQKHITAYFEKNAIKI
jgi:branched-subunit amino acid aminotransferase/4-amino-4-deoxychorismate lyase